MWKPFIYQHLVGLIFVAIAYSLYLFKTDKNLLRMQGKKTLLLPMVAVVFYFILNFIWTAWALGEI